MQFQVLPPTLSNNISFLLYIYLHPRMKQVNLIMVGFEMLMFCFVCDLILTSKIKYDKILWIINQSSRQNQTYEGIKWYLKLDSGEFFTETHVDNTLFKKLNLSS